MTTTCDCIVLGVGGFGAAAVDHLARRGLRVVGLEQFGVAHDRGSSHGETRIIRKAYFEHPDYVPLLERAYVLWRELADDAGRALFELGGLLLAGPAQGEAIAGARLAAKRHGVVVESVAPGDAAARFDGFRIPAGFDVVFEPDAGWLFVEDCVRSHIERAIRAGAVVHTGERAVDWSSDGTRVRVVTDADEYEAATLIVTAGAWAGPLLEELDVALSVVRKPVFWHPTTATALHAANGCPAFYFEMPTGAFYGFPSLDGRTLKIAEHTGGERVPDPSAIDCTIREAETAPIRTFIEEVLPDVRPEAVRSSVCMYTHSPDGHFIVDRHPQFANVVVACGFSGHGFKFTTVLGEALADLAVDGATRLPIGFLRIRKDEG